MTKIQETDMDVDGASTEFEGVAQSVIEGVKMYASWKKVTKLEEAEPTKLEESVAMALFIFESKAPQELKSDLKDLYIDSAFQLGVSEERKALVIHYPYKLRKGFRKIHLQLMRELEQKFPGNFVFLIPRRRWYKPRGQLIAVIRDAMLRDIVRPGNLVGKCVYVDSDNKEDIRYYLDQETRHETEHKLQAFTAVFKYICQQDSAFMYPII